MIAIPEVDLIYPLTDGEIAVNNLESARQAAWSRFWSDSLRPSLAEQIIEQEQLTLQFLGDTRALDRLDELVKQLDRVDADSPRTLFIRAQVASNAHRFAEARRYLERITDCAALSASAKRLSLSIDQACGTRLEGVLEARQKMAVESSRIEDFVPLGALYTDLCKFEDACWIYHRALREYANTSPFAVAWVCFQLGMLWGELIPEVQLTRAEYWYRQAIQYLPCYVKARVHLSEIYLRQNLPGEAEAILTSAILSGDPEISWRLADVLIASGRITEAKQQMQAARSGFETLLDKHLLAFADHAAEYYAGSGSNPQRAFELASVNLANRSTLRAFEQAYETALAAGLRDEALKVLAAAKNRWGATGAFGFSRLSRVAHDHSASEGAVP